MSTPPTIHLAIDPDALPAVTFALQRTIDDLEARALVAVDRDVDLGPSSAAEYRDDIDRLAGLLGQLGVAPGRPDPERAAVLWFDGVDTIDGHRPLLHQPQPVLTRCSRPPSPSVTTAASPRVRSSRRSPRRPASTSSRCCVS